MDQHLRTIRIDARPDHVERALLDPALLALIREGWRPMPIPLVMEMGNPEAGDSRPVLLLILCPPVRPLKPLRVIPDPAPPTPPAPPAPAPAILSRPALIVFGMVQAVLLIGVIWALLT